jgi:hypothetical protein
MPHSAAATQFDCKMELRFASARRAFAVEPAAAAKPTSIFLENPGVNAGAAIALTFSTLTNQTGVPPRDDHRYRARPCRHGLLNRDLLGFVQVSAGPLTGFRARRRLRRRRSRADGEGSRRPRLFLPFLPLR